MKAKLFLDLLPEENETGYYQTEDKNTRCKPIMGPLERLLLPPWPINITVRAWEMTQR